MSQWHPLKVELSKAAKRDIRGLEEKWKRRVLVAVKRYAETGDGDVKRLKGLPDFRLRVGDYRVRFSLEGDEVLIMLVQCVGHRREIYK